VHLDALPPSASPRSSAWKLQYSLQIYHFDVFRLARRLQRCATRFTFPVDHRGRKPGTVLAETDPISFFARRGKTRRSINSETNERWDAGFCTGRTAAGMGRPHEREKEGMKGKRDGVAEEGRGPTGKGWNRGRTINLTIYQLRERGARSEEEA